MAALVVVAALLPVGEPAAASPAAPIPAATKDNRTVTLVTGDRVRLATAPDRTVTLLVEPAPGREKLGFLRETSTGKDGVHHRVVPADAVPLLAEGRLDPRLFDVTTLARQPAGDTPVLLTYTGARAAGVVGGRTVRALPAINGAAVRAKGAEFWDWVRTRPAGLGKVWLDGTAQPTLAASVRQIGAAAAWRSGLTGSGVTVGVLDSGVDGGHPDLAGKLLAQQDFTGTLPQGGDDLGHGTHVAGIIASAGREYRGVAPDVKLVSGKVCVAFGCPDSMVIAGLEWIAPRAKVVNLSLGGDTTDGTDPVSRALNTLSAKHGTLFVVSSGNDRGIDPPDPLAGVTAPASADAALAVGSVTAEDTPSPFTSHGPRLGDHAVKPDIAAPGSGVVSARVPGTPTGDADPVDERHSRASGTSMAAPHVTGAAALLLQQNPQWTVDRLKSQLMSSATPTAGVFDQGAGRVDVARAISQSVRDSGSVSFGFLPYRQSATKTVRYHNDGPAPVTLNLALDENPAFALSANQVTVPAGGSAEVAVTARSTGPAGPQGIRLTATAPGISVRTALGAVLEPESYHLTLKIRSRGGKFSAALAQAVDTSTGAATGPRFDAAGTAVLRLPKGRYDINALDLAEQSTVVTLLSRTGLSLTRDTELTLDATTAKPVRATVDRPGARHQYGEFGLVSGERSGVRTSTLSWTSGPGQQLFAAATPGQVTDHTYAYFQRATLGPAHPATGPVPYLYHLAFLERGRIPATLDRRVRDHELATVDSRYHDQGRPATGQRADYARLPVPGTTNGMLISYPLALPAQRVEYFTAHPDVTWQQLLVLRPPDESDAELHWSVRTLRPGRSTTGWNRAPFGPAFGDPERGWGAHRIGESLQFGVPLLSGNDPALVTEPPPVGMTGRTTLSRDGRQLGVADTPGSGVFPVPVTGGRYTVHASATRTVPWSDLGSRAEVSWTFRDAGEGKPLPVLAVRATGQVDEHNRARAGAPYLLNLSAHHQPGAPTAPITALTAEVSYDEGRTWTRSPVLRFGANGHTLLNHPRGNGFVALRLTAADADGNSVTQTVYRAYGLSDR
ncbi:S8 family peptidase [Crossiella sp. NPDC003009]